MMRCLILLALLLCLPVRGEAWQVVGGGGSPSSFCASQGTTLFCEDFSDGNIDGWSGATGSYQMYEGKAAIKLIAGGGQEEVAYTISPKALANGAIINWEFKTFRPCSGGFNIDAKFEVQGVSRWKSNVTCGAWTVVSGTFTANSNPDLIKFISIYNTSGTEQYFTELKFW